ncbi:efflux RND transporter periplasmic adaptor subunit [Phyllobacterium phragmitis]|uniref:Efflux RND transporter periplasmic adaptor subunit n=1 Tax=Phyllobacterium phragmitis TaxID=2670329 RepID=A0ABQ0H723_9HYPH
MRTSAWIAIGLLAAASAWFASSLVIGGSEEGKENAATAARPPQPTLVEVQPSTAEPVPLHIYAQGVAQPYRTADVVSSTGGTLDQVLVKEGDEVKAGAVLARVRPEARESQLRSAQARVNSLEADLQGLRDLEGQGYATESGVRDLESQLAEARASLQSIREEILDTTIEAPIPGIVNDVFANAGETLGAGTAVLRIVDNSPLRITLHISQRDIGRVDVGRVAAVSFATGDLAKGRVCFVAPAADPETRTFRVEIRVPNETRDIPSVVSVEVRFQTGEAEAHFVSPAILALNEEGTLGVKSVGEGGAVRFHKVEITRAVNNGIWVSGLPEKAQLIITGQGFVREGERVRVRKSEEGEQQNTAEAAAKEARLPTATIEAEHFDRAENLTEPPPAEVLCQGSASNRISTNSMPTGSTGATGAGVSTQSPGVGSSTGGTTGSQGSSPGMSNESGTQQGAGSGQSVPVAPSPEITPPRVSIPPLAQPPSQAPGPTQGQGGATQGGGASQGGGAAPPAAGSGGGATGSTPPGGAGGGAQ